VAEELGSLAVKIGLDSSGFQNGISSINRNLRVLDSEFKANTAALGENAKSLDGLKLKSESLSKQLDLQKQKVSALEQAYTKSADTKGKDSRATQELEIKLNKAKQTLSQMESELSRANKEVEVQSSKWTILGKSLDTMGSKMKTVGEGFSNVGSKLSIGITAPLVGIGTAATKMAMDAVESENLFEVSMGNMATSARAWSEDISKSLGLNAYEVRKNVATFNVMLGSMGLTEKEAYNMSTSLTKLAYDMASFYNLKPEEAFEKLRAGISGETEPLKSLGINISDTAVKAYALQQGLAKQGQEMTEQQKISARFGLIMQSTSKAQGDLGRTMDSPTNKLRIMQQQAQQLGIQFGQILIPVLETLIATIKPIMDGFQGLSKGQQELIVKIALIVAALGPVLVIIGQVITVGSSLVTLFGSISTAVGAAGGVMALITGPIGIAVIAITSLIAIGVILYNNWDTIKTKASELWNGIVLTFQNIKTSIANAWESVKTATLTAWENLKNTISSGLNSIKTFLEPALNFFKTIFQNTWNIIKNIVLGAVLVILDIVTGNFTKLKSDIQNIGNNIKTALTNIWEAIKSTAVNAWSNLRETVINLCSNIKENVINIWNGILNWFSGLPGRLYIYGSNMFARMRDGLSSSIGSIRGSIESGINNALSYLASLPGKAWSYGADFVQGIINGIRSAIGRVEDAVSGLAAKIRSYLHFSVPDEGPLTDYQSWMPDFMMGLAEGINRNKNVVAEAVKGLSLDMKVNTKAQAVETQSSSNYKENQDQNISNTKGLILNIENFNNYTEKDIERLAYELEFYRQRIAMGKGGV
jgi:phage-related minor tail protein